MTFICASRRCRPVECIALRPLPSLLWVDLSMPLTGDEWDDLSAEEHRKAARFRCLQDQRRYLAAHSALRRALAAQGAGEPSSLRFRAGAWGKPALCDSTGLRFNLSHSGDIGLIGSSFLHEVGVDAEFIRAVPDAASLVSEHFSVDERREFERLPPQTRNRAFLVGWTRKEACLKAVGVGLSVDPSSIEAGLTCEPCMLTIALGVEWSVVEVHSILGSCGVVGAVAQVHSQRAGRLPIASIGWAQ